jgi:5-methylcytosine-specific restriction endonuclease McrA
VAWDTDRKARLPSDWKRRRVKVLRRDGYSCQAIEQGRRCGAPANQVDHVIAGDDHSLDNLQSLCASHHAKKSSQEGVAARAKYPNKRPPESHPGLNDGGTLRQFMNRDGRHLAS